MIKIYLIVSCVTVAILIVLFSYTIGYRYGVKRQKYINLRKSGLNKHTADHYAEVITFLNKLTIGVDLDGEYVGNILTDATYAAICRFIARYRKEMDI